MFRDNQNAIACSFSSIQKINWKQNANTANDFQFIKTYNFTTPSNCNIDKVCLTHDGKHLLIGSKLNLYIFTLKTATIKETFKLNIGFIAGIELFEDGSKAAIVDQKSGGLIIIDTNFDEKIYPKKQTVVTKRKQVCSMEIFFK